MLTVGSRFEDGKRKEGGFEWKHLHHRKKKVLAMPSKKMSLIPPVDSTGE